MSALTSVIPLLLSAAIPSTAHSSTTKPDVPHPWRAVPQNKVSVNRGDRIQMTVSLVRQNKEKLDEIFWAVSTPGNPKYGEHLGHEEMRALVSPGSEAIAAVKDWIHGAGVQDIDVARHEDSMIFTATVEQIEALLQVRFESYKNEATGALLPRALDQGVIPDSLKHVVEVVSGHTGFPVTRRRSAKTMSAGEPKINMTVCENHPHECMKYQITPEQVWEHYGIPDGVPVPNGKRNIQAVIAIGDGHVRPQDLENFCQDTMPNRMANCTISEIVGINYPYCGLETIMDAEFILAGSRGQLDETWLVNPVFNGSDYAEKYCNSWMWYSHKMLSLETFPYVNTLSYSWNEGGMCSETESDRLNENVKVMGTMGITVMIASDDGGGTHEEGSWIPYAVAVGATQFPGDGRKPASYEVATDFSGGGFSNHFPRPSYQDKAVEGFFKTAAANGKLPPAGSFNRNGRAAPDVAALGNFMYMRTCISGSEGGGTSASTPYFSGMVSLLNNIRLGTKGKTLGFINPLLYANPDAFNDVTQGTTFGNRWHAMEGWDATTGLGTPNMTRLVEIVKNLP